MKFLHEIVANRSYNVDISTSNVIDFMKYPNDLEITGLNTNTSRTVSIGTVCNKLKFYDFGVLCENLQWYDVDTRVTYSTTTQTARACRRTWSRSTCSRRT